MKADIEEVGPSNGSNSDMILSYTSGLEIGSNS